MPQPDLLTNMLYPPVLNGLVGKVRNFRNDDESEERSQAFLHPWAHSIAILLQLQDVRIV